MANTRSSRRFKKLAANVRAQLLPCYLCREPIDYTLEWPDPRSFSVEHIKPWSTHPESREDPSNLAAAHLTCNTAKGNSVRVNTRLDGMKGPTSRAW